MCFFLLVFFSNLLLQHVSDLSTSIGLSSGPVYIAGEPIQAYVTITNWGPSDSLSGFNNEIDSSSGVVTTIVASSPNVTCVNGTASILCSLSYISTLQVIIVTVTLSTATSSRYI